MHLNLALNKSRRRKHIRFFCVFRLRMRWFRVFVSVRRGEIRFDVCSDHGSHIVWTYTHSLINTHGINVACVRPVSLCFFGGASGSSVLCFICKYNNNDIKSKKRNETNTPWMRYALCMTGRAYTKPIHSAYYLIDTSVCVCTCKR